MIRRPPRSTRTDTLFPYTTLCRSGCILNQPLSSDALAQLFTEARTFNGYLDKPVPVEMLHALWDLMKMGPTSANQLPARIVWCVSQEAKDKLAALASGNNAPKIQAAPVAAILAMDENFHDYLPELYPALRSEENRKSTRLNSSH